MSVLTGSAYNFTDKETGRQVSGVTLQVCDGAVYKSSESSGLRIQKISISTGEPFRLLSKMIIPGHYVVEMVLSNKKLKPVNLYHFGAIDPQFATPQEGEFGEGEFGEGEYEEGEYEEGEYEEGEGGEPKPAEPQQPRKRHSSPEKEAKLMAEVQAFKERLAREEKAEAKRAAAEAKRKADAEAKAAAAEAKRAAKLLADTGSPKPPKSPKSPKPPKPEVTQQPFISPADAAEEVTQPPFISPADAAAAAAEKPPENEGGQV